MKRRSSAKKKKQKKDNDSDSFGDDQVVVQPKPPCFISLEDEPHEEVEVTSPVKREFKLVFPRNASDSITITQGDIDRLEPGVHLNDNIIDFYLKYLKHHGLIQSLQKRFYFFNTYFYTTLSKESGLERVKKWTKDIDIFLYDFLMIPIHDKEHWRLVIVCYPAECENYKAEQDEKSKAALLLFDSLSWVDKKIYKTIRTYLSFEWENKRKKKLEFTAKSIPGIKPKVPVQDNNIDCGVFVLKYAEKFCTEPPDDLIENPPQYFKWFGADDIPMKRQEVKNLLERLFAEERARLGWDDGEDEEANGDNDEEMNGTGDENKNDEEKEDKKTNGHNDNNHNKNNHSDGEEMDMDKNDVKNNNGESDDRPNINDEDNSRTKTKKRVRSPTRQSKQPSQDEDDDNDHSGPTTDYEMDPVQKISMRQLLKEKLHAKVKLKESGDSVKPINSPQHSNDDSLIVSELDTNDDSETKVSLRSILKKSLEEASESNENNHKVVNNNSHSKHNSKDENSASAPTSGKSSPRKRSRSRSRSKQINDGEADSVMLEVNDSNKSTEQDDSVVLLGAATGSPFRRSSRVLRKSNNK